MANLVYTPKGRFTHEGTDYVLLERTIDKLKGAMYAIYRVQETKVMSRDKPTISAEEPTVFPIDDLDKILEIYKSVKAKANNELTPMLFNAIVEARPELAMSSYLYLGDTVSRSVEQVFANAYLERLYGRILLKKAGKTNVIVISKAQALEIHSLQLILTAAEVFKAGLKEELIAGFENTRYTFSAPSYVTQCTERNEWTALNPKVRPYILRHQLKIIPTEKGDYILVSYSYINADRSISDAINATISRSFPMRDGLGWKTAHQILMDKNDPYNQLLSEVFAVANR